MPLAPVLAYPPFHRRRADRKVGGQHRIAAFVAFIRGDDARAQFDRIRFGHPPQEITNRSPRQGLDQLR